MYELFCICIRFFVFSFPSVTTGHLVRYHSTVYSKEQESVRNFGRLGVVWGAGKRFSVKKATAVTWYTCDSSKYNATSRQLNNAITTRWSAVAFGIRSASASESLLNALPHTLTLMCVPGTVYHPVGHWCVFAISSLSVFKLVPGTSLTYVHLFCL